MILDTGWRVTEIEGAALARDAQPSLTLAPDGSFHGRACNGFRGSYAIEGERLAFGRVAATKMACAEPLMAMETALFAALRRVAGYRLMRNGALWLEDEDGNVLIEAYRDDQ